MQYRNRELHSLRFARFNWNCAHHALGGWTDPYQQRAYTTICTPRWRFVHWRSAPRRRLTPQVWMRAWRRPGVLRDSLVPPPGRGESGCLDEPRCRRLPSRRYSSQTFGLLDLRALAPRLPRKPRLLAFRREVGFWMLLGAAAAAVPEQWRSAKSIPWGMPEPPPTASARSGILLEISLTGWPRRINSRGATTSMASVRGAVTTLRRTRLSR